MFSTEVDTCDAILFMLSTSASKDLYKRFLNPARIGRATAARRAGRRPLPAASIGVLLSIWLQTVIGAITVFYSLLVVTLFVPVIGGLYVRRARQPGSHGRGRRGCRRRSSWYALGLPEPTRGWTRR